MTRAYHVVDTFHTQHITNLMRVGNDTYRAVTDSDACKLVRHHHAALDMHVSVNEARHDVWPRLSPFRQLTTSDVSNLPFSDDDLTIVYLTTHHVDDMSLYVLHTSYFLKWSLRILMTKMMAAQAAVMKLVIKKKIPVLMPCSMQSIRP